MANKILFKTSTSNDSTKLIPASGTSTIAKIPGTVYFTKDGKIIYDLDSNTRLVMSDSVSHAVSADTADRATGDKNGKDITTYMASAAWDSTTPTTLNLKNSLGTNIFSVKLAEKFLPLIAGPDSPLTGDLYLSAGNEDRFLNFKYTGTGYDWRIGYLGSGSGNENYLVIQSDGSDGVTWTNALRFGLTDLNATFGGSILPSTTGTKDLGSSSLRWKGIYGQTLNLSGNATIGDAASDSHVIKGTVTQTGNFLPGTSVTYNLGSDSAKWKILYIGDGTDATSTTTGAIRATGGIAATGSGYFGGNLTAVKVNGKALSLTETATAGNGIYLYRNDSANEALRINVDANNGTITNTNETLQSILNLVLEYKDTANQGAGAGSKTVAFKATSSGSEVTATKFIGNLTGTASKATADASNRNIEQTYLKSVTLENEYKMYRTTGNGTKTLVGDIAPLDANQLIPLKYLPASALERIYVVEDDDARLALTILEVQNGDVVRVNSTNLMYLVYDDIKLGTEDAFKIFVAGSAANADNARYAESAGKATYDSNGNKIDESYIIYPFVLNADKTKVTLTNGVGDETPLDYNYYPTAMTWVGGTSAGPTATISMAGTTDIAVGAIPSASGSASGIVTTGTQTFGGAKTFNNNVTV